MQTGAITQYIDVAQLVLYAFWIFFAALILYLRMEDKREGYPLESDRTARTKRVSVVGFPGMPAPKEYTMSHGGSFTTPIISKDPVDIAAKPIGPWLGAPLEPTGNPMIDGVGPAAWTNRATVPDLTVDGALKIVPLRVATDFSIEASSPDPRGMKVLGADRKVGGTVTDVWIDRSEPQIRYLEVQVVSSTGPRQVLLPIGFVRLDAERRLVLVKSILGSQFADVPGLDQPDQVTLREEDRVSAYYGGGHLYAEPTRVEPLV